MNPLLQSAADRITESLQAERWAMREPDGTIVGPYTALCPVGQTMVFPDVELDPQASEFVRQHPALNLRSLVVLPLYDQPKAVWMLEFHNPTVSELDETITLLRRHYGDMAAVSMRM